MTNHTSEGRDLGAAATCGRGPPNGAVAPDLIQTCSGTDLFSVSVGGAGTRRAPFRGGKHERPLACARRGGYHERPTRTPREHHVVFVILGKLLFWRWHFASV